MSTILAKDSERVAIYFKSELQVSVVYAVPGKVMRSRAGRRE